MALVSQFKRALQHSSNIWSWTATEMVTAEVGFGGVAINVYAGNNESYDNMGSVSMKFQEQLD